MKTFNNSTLNFILLFVGLLIFTNISKAECYVDTDLQCEAAESSIVGWSGKGPIVRKLLFNTTDVQQNQKNCILFAVLIKNECQIKEPVQAIYTHGQSSFPNFILTFESQLINLPTLPDVFKKYFAGTLIIPPIPIQEISATQVESLAPGAVPPPVILRSTYNSSATSPISSEVALAVAMFKKDGQYKFQAKPIYGSLIHNQPYSPAPMTSDLLFNMSFVGLPALIELTVNIETSVTCSAKGPFKFRINPSLILTTSENPATWPRLNMTKCGAENINSYNLGTGRFSATLLTDQSTTGFAAFSVEFIGYNSGPNNSFPINSQFNFVATSGYYYYEELPITLSLYRRSGASAPVLVSTKTITTATSAPLLNFFPDQGFTRPFPNAFSIYDDKLTDKPTVQGNYYYYTTFKTKLGNLHKSSESFFRVVSDRVNGSCKLTTDSSYYPPPPCLQGNWVSLASTTTQWNWQCVGLNGGTTSTCSSPRKPPESPKCLPYNSIYENQPAKNTESGCSKGAFEERDDYFDPITGYYTYSWQCRGLGTEYYNTTLICKAPSNITKINGKCKAYAGNYSTQPAVTTGAGCEAGEYQDSAGESSLAFWTWTCKGLGGGVSASCSANSTTPVAGECRYPYGGPSVAMLTQEPVDGFHTAQNGTYVGTKFLGCTAGTFVDKPDIGTTTWTWTCNGINGGTSSQCSNPKMTVHTGVCKTFSTALQAEPTNQTACDGIYTDLADTATQWKWQCLGKYDGKASAVCTANKSTGVLNGACGTAQGKRLTGDLLTKASSSTSTICSSGTYVASDANGKDGTYNWSCAGLSGGTTATCSAFAYASCGSSSGQLLSEYPTSNLCSSGVASATDTVASDRTYDWTCTVPNPAPASVATCSAQKNPPVPPPFLVAAQPEFDPQFYLKLYPNLFTPTSTNFNAQTHWLDLGVEQGLRGSQVFDPKEYLFYNPDITAIYGTTNYRAALNHFTTAGVSEGRRSSFEFDPKYYLDNNSDLKSAYGTNYLRAYIHWQTVGLKEGRRSSVDFDIRYYLNSNEDVLTSVGANNYEGAFYHWMNTGKLQNRRTVLDTSQCFSSSKTWSVGTNTCTADLAQTLSGSSNTAVDTTEPIKGSASYTCNNGSWSTAPTSSTCAITPPPPAPAPCLVINKSWTVGSSSCSANLPQVNSGLSSTATDSVAPVTGSATYSCSNGVWSTSPTSSTCVTAPPAGACLATSKTWTIGTSSCSASLPQVNSGLSSTATDSVAPVTGSATYSCSNGVWSTSPTSSTCVTATTKSPCLAANKSWTVGKNTCSANLAQANSGTTGIATDSVDPLTGSATYSCENGSWSITPTNVTCAQSTAPVF